MHYFSLKTINFNTYYS